MTRVVVIPTYCEAGNLPTLIPRLLAVDSGLHILIVDDDSPDGTADAADELDGDSRRVHVLRRSAREGLGVAYRAGFKWALEQGYDEIAGMDADLSHDPDVLPTLFALLGGDADLVIGSRYQPGGHIPDWPWHRRLLSSVGNTYARLILGVDVRDMSSGFRAYRSETVAALMQSTLRADGYGFLIECVYRVARRGGVIEESPITFRDRTWGAS